MPRLVTLLDGSLPPLVRPNCFILLPRANKSSENHHLAISIDHWREYFNCSLMWLTAMRDIGHYAEKASVDALMGCLKIDGEFEDPIPVNKKCRKTENENATDMATTAQWHGTNTIAKKLKVLLGLLPNLLNERRLNPVSYDYDASDEGELESYILRSTSKN